MRLCKRTGCLAVAVFALRLDLPAADGAAPGQGPRNVVLVNSYHLGHPWTQDLTRGLIESFRRAPVEIEVWTEFLDSRRLPGREREEAFAQSLAAQYRQRLVDVVVAADDAAVSFILERGERLFPGVPVVFCGVSAEDVFTRALRRGWGGLRETFEVGPWVDLALRLRPANRRLAIVTDKSPANVQRRDAFRKIAAGRRDLEFEFLDGETISFEEIIARLRELPAEAVVIATTYSNDRQGGYVSPWSAGKAMAQASRAPILSPNSRFLGQGILAGNADAGYAHGFEVGGLVLKTLLQGVSSAGAIQHGPMLPVVDAALLDRFRVRNVAWPQGTTFVNRRTGWREAYREHQLAVWLTTLFILGQFAIIASLILNHRRYRRAQSQLLNTRDRMERGQRIARLGTWERNLQTGLLTWSDEVFHIYGLRPGEIVPTFDFVKSVICPEDLPGVLQEIERADRMKTGRRMDYRITRADGEIRHLRIQAEIQVNRRGDGVLMGTVQDVTEFREMEERVRHAERMESVGNLAGGIAHDFNNLLTVINGYSDVLLGRLSPADSMRPQLAEIRKAGARAAELTRELLAFSRKQVIRPAAVDVNEVVLSVRGMLEPMLGKHITLRYELAPWLPAALLDRAQFEQSLMNLASNARDAMQDGGEFTLTTRLSSAEAPSEPGDRQWVEVHVADTGTGMDESTQRRIFDPYFTTKPTGKGTGLGLASVYGFVNQSGGQIEVQSALGQGTRLILRLPLVADSPGGNGLDPRP